MTSKVNTEDDLESVEVDVDSFDFRDLLETEDESILKEVNKQKKRRLDDVSVSQCTICSAVCDIMTLATKCYFCT